MDLDTAKSFTEKHPGFVTLVGPKTNFLSASKAAVKGFGFKSIEQLKKVSYLDIPVKARAVTKLCKKNDDILFQEKMPFLKELGFWYLNNNTAMLLTCEKIPVKDNNGNVVALLCSSMDITNCNLIDQSRYLRLAEDKYGAVDYGQFVYKFINNITVNQYNISIREMECLFYVIRGHSAKSIGKRLGLSYRTVEDHIEKIKYKFHCTSKTELIEKAIIEGYMNMLPQNIIF